MLPALLGILSPIIDKVLGFIPNVTEREKAKLEYETQMAANETELIKVFSGIDQGQIEVNKVEAANPGLFVAGWRPFVGWVCGIGVAWTFVLKPVLDWVLAIVKPGLVTPVLASGDLMSLLLGMLGMGALRSYEKVRGVAK